MSTNYQVAQLHWKRNSEGRVTKLFLQQIVYFEGTIRRFSLKDSKPAITPKIP